MTHATSALVQAKRRKVEATASSLVAEKQAIVSDDTCGITEYISDHAGFQGILKQVCQPRAPFNLTSDARTHV